MARNDDRHRIRAERVARGPHRPRAASLAGDGRVGAHLTEGDARRGLEHPAREAAGERPVDRHVEARCAARRSTRRARAGAGRAARALRAPAATAWRRAPRGSRPRCDAQVGQPDQAGRGGRHRSAEPSGESSVA